MNINFTPFAILWMVFALMIVALAAYRWLVSEQEQETLHLSNPREITHQAAIARRLDTIDRWGEVLTIVAPVYSLLLAGGYAYYLWVTWNAKAF
jgi:hypothetical protein